MGIVIGHGRRIVIRLSDEPIEQRERALPLDARLAMFVLEAEAADADDSPRPRFLRRDKRLSCRFAAALLYARSDAPAPADTLSAASLTESASVYVRDISPGHAGFVSRHLLPGDAGQICWLQLEQADGTSVTLRGQIERYRPFMDGWHEGVIRFELEADESAQSQSDDQALRIAV